MHGECSWWTIIIILIIIIEIKITIPLACSFCYECAIVEWSDRRWAEQSRKRRSKSRLRWGCRCRRSTASKKSGDKLLVCRGRPILECETRRKICAKLKARIDPKNPCYLQKIKSSSTWKLWSAVRAARTSNRFETKSRTCFQYNLFVPEMKRATSCELDTSIRLWLCNKFKPQIGSALNWRLASSNSLNNILWKIEIY